MIHQAITAADGTNGRASGERAIYGRVPLVTSPLVCPETEAPLSALLMKDTCAQVYHIACIVVSKRTIKTLCAVYVVYAGRDGA